MGDAWEAARDVTLPNGKPVLGRYHGRIIVALSRCLIPDGGELPVSVNETLAHEFLAKYLRDQAAGARLGIKMLLLAFDLAPVLFIGRFARFVNLTPQEQELYLQDWYASRIYYRRMAMVLLKTLMGMGFYNDPKVLDAIGFKQPCGQGGRK